MRIVFIGSVEFSQQAFNELLNLRANIVGVCTLAKSSINSDHADLSETAMHANIPVRFTPNINDSASVDWVRALRPDVLFCFGWSYLLKREILSLPTIGTVGYHPSYLPANRGRHPLIWALALGLTETASTFFFMDEGTDSGDILSQEVVPISADDDASTLYATITQVALRQIRAFLPQLSTRTYTAIPQDHLHANHWRRRDASDGLIDWRMAATSIYNLVRALTHPYVGAHFLFDGEPVKVWSSEVISDAPSNIEPGKIISVDSRGPIIKAGIGALRLLETTPHVKFETGNYL